MTGLLAAPDAAFERMVVYQDRMRGATEYTAWAQRGEPQTYAIDAPIDGYLAYLDEHGDMLVPAAAVDSGINPTFLSDQDVWAFVKAARLAPVKAPTNCTIPATR